MIEFTYQEMFPLGPDATEYRRLTSDFVSDSTFECHAIVKIAPDGLTLLA